MTKFKVIYFQGQYYALIKDLNNNQFEYRKILLYLYSSNLIGTIHVTANANLKSITLDWIPPNYILPLISSLFKLYNLPLLAK